MKLGRWNPNKLSLDDIFRCNVFCLQQLASNFDAQINGIVAIVDLQNLSLNQARHFTPSYAKKIADLLTVRTSLPTLSKALQVLLARRMANLFQTSFSGQ